MKSYTDLEQSKKLAEILPLESADCFWDYDEMQGFHRISWFEDGFNKHSQLLFNENNVCAWSLAALLDYLSANFHVDIKYLDNYWELCCRIQVTYITYNKELIDTCYEMILKLYEQKLL